MTDIRDELDALWYEVRDLKAGRSLAEQQAMLSRLGAGAQPVRVSVAGADDPSGGYYMNLPAAYQGNVLTITGHPNLLIDPTFESLSYTATLIAVPFPGDTNGYWAGYYELVSGVPGFDVVNLEAGPDRTMLQDSAPFHSAQAMLNFVAGTAGTANIYLYPVNALVTIDAVLPYLVAACRVYPTSFDAATAITATLQLYDATHNTIIAESNTWDVYAMGTTEPVPYKLVVSTQQSESYFGSRQWRWRLKVTFTHDGAGGGTGTHVMVAEPQLHYAYTPDPLPYSPAVSFWMPPVRPADVRAIGTAADHLVVNRHAVIHPFSIGANITLTSTPTIRTTNPPMTIEGHEIVLLNIGTAILTIQDNGTLANSGLRLTAATIALGPRDSVRLAYYVGLGWVQIGPVVAVI